MEKELIQKEIEKLNLKEPINKWWSLLVVGIGGGLGALFIVLFVIKSEGSDSNGWYALLAFGIIFIVAGAIVSLWLSRVYNRVATENAKKVLPVWEEWHRLYFDNTVPFFGKNYQLSFEGIVESKAFSGAKALSFTLNEEKIVFSLAEDVERRTRTVKHGDTTVTETYYVYFLKYNLKSEASVLEGYDQITMQSGKVRKAKEGFFSSESIAFNNKYVVSGHNQLQIYKLFTPKVVDNYVNYENLGSDRITLENKRAYVNFRSSNESTVSYYPDVANLGLINWKKDRVVDSLFNKIKKNFDAYINTQADLIPLKIYDK